MPTVRVRLAGQLAKLAPAPLVTLELTSGATVADAREQLAREHAELAAALPSAVAVVRGEQAAPGQQLTAGDELSLIPPVSGG